MADVAYHFSTSELINYVYAGGNKIADRHIELCQVCRTIVHNIRETENA